MPHRLQIRRTRLTVPIVRLGLAALLITGCSSAGRSRPASPTSSPNPPPTTTSATAPTTTRATSPAVTTTSHQRPTTTASPGPTRAALPTSGLSDAVRVVRSDGFTPIDTSDFTYPADRVGLHVIIAVVTGSGTGYADQAFFFAEGRLIGTDLTGTSAAIRLAWRTDTTIALNYAIYEPDDPMCCPLGGARTVRYEWNGTRLEPLDPIPADDIRR